MDRSLGECGFNALQPNQSHAQTMLFLNAYEFGFNIVFVFCGLHILGLGYLMLAYPVYTHTH